MGWFKSKNKNDFKWLNIVDTKSYNDAISQSYIEPILIFKHSTRCSISSLALNRIESNDNKKVINHCYFLDLLSYRDISNKIAKDFNVTHESPQVLVIKNEKCIYHASHYNISWDNMKV